MANKGDLFPFGECLICSGKATGVHYGANTCDGCKGFFKRCDTDRKTFTCYLGNNCAITPKSRNTCKACRLRLCLECGMSMDAIRIGRKSNLEKEYTRKQIQDKEWSSAQKMLRGMKDNIASISVENKESSVKPSSLWQKPSVLQGHPKKYLQDQAVLSYTSSQKSAEEKSWTSITGDADQAENVQDGKTTTKLIREAEDFERSWTNSTYRRTSELSGDIDQPAAQQKASITPTSLSMAFSQTSSMSHVGEATTNAVGDKSTVYDSLAFKRVVSKIQNPKWCSESKIAYESSSKKNVSSSDKTAMGICGSQSSNMAISSTSDGNRENTAQPNIFEPKKTSLPLCGRWSWRSEEEFNLSTKYFEEQDHPEEWNAQKAEESSQNNSSTTPTYDKYKKQGIDASDMSMLDTKFTSDSHQVTIWPACSSSNNACGRIERIILSLDEAVNVLFGPVYERRQLLKDYREGKVNLTTPSSDQKECMEHFLPNFFVELKEEMQRMSEFTNKLPGFCSLRRNDQAKLWERHLTQIKLLTSCEFIGKTRGTCYVLNKSQIVTTNAVYNLIRNDTLVDGILELLDDIYNLNLSSMEMTALCATTATNIDDLEVEDPSSINALNLQYLEVFTHLLRISDRPDKSTMAVDIFYRVLPYLRDVASYISGWAESLLMEEVNTLYL